MKKDMLDKIINAIEAIEAFMKIYNKDSEESLQEMLFIKTSYPEEFAKGLQTIINDNNQPDELVGRAINVLALLTNSQNN